MSAAPRWQRRARPLLGTLVEVGWPATADDAPMHAAFAAIAQLQSQLSRFEVGSDVYRFNAAGPNEWVALQPWTQGALQAALGLHTATDGAFDVSLGSGLQPEHLQGANVLKAQAHTRIDLGGIGKGLAVDVACEALRAAGAHSGWVNAGGDLRAWGEAELPVVLRDEQHGGVRPWLLLAEGACASSHFAPGSRSKLWATTPQPRHVSVVAPQALWADALTKVVAITGQTEHPLLTTHGAQAWVH